MLSAWLRNFLGFPVSEYEMQQINEPSFELGVHITFKTVQACSVLGVGILGPALAASQPGLTTVGKVVRMSGRCGRMAAMVGLVAGPIWTAAIVTSNSMEQVTDMCYRLRRHTPQLMVDRLSSTGLGTGYFLGTVLGYSAGNCGVFGLVGGLMMAELIDISQSDHKERNSKH